MNRTLGILNITDGTTTVDLLGINNGVFYYRNWLSTQAQVKSGIFQSRGISDGRLPTRNQVENVTETIDVGVRGGTADVAIGEIRKLQKLMRQAVNHWSDPGHSIVYIEARNPGETTTRYAAIVNGSLGNIGPMFGQPFVQGSRVTVIESVSVIIERRGWQDQIPASYYTIPIQQYKTVPWNVDTYRYGYVDFASSGVQPTIGESSAIWSTYEEEAIWVANHEPLVASITHIFRYDVSLASYSTNLADMTDAGLDWQAGVELFPTPRAIGDYTLFGASDAAAYASDYYDDSGFSSLVITLDQQFTDWDNLDAGRSVNWEAYVGGAWVDCGGYIAHHMQDTGALPVGVLAGGDWTATTINGVSARWVRAILTDTSGDYPRLTQRAPYVPRNSVRVPGTYITGDIKARPIISLKKWSPPLWNFTGVASDDDDSYSSHHVYGGIRSVSRGADFRSCIPAYTSNDTDTQAWGYYLAPGEGGTIVDLSLYPTNKVLKYTPVDQTWKSPFNVLIGYDIYESYVGTYTAFLRFRKDGTTSDYNIRLQGMANADLWLSANVPLWEMERYSAIGTDTQSYAVVQFNNVVLPDMGAAKRFGFRVSAQATTGTDALYLLDITLIPTDQWAFSIKAPNIGGGYTVQFPEGGVDVDKFYTDGHLTIDATGQDGALDSIMRRWAGLPTTRWISDSWHTPYLPPGDDVEIFFYSIKSTATDSNDSKWSADIRDMMSVQVGAVGEFFNFIGDNS